MFDSNSRYAGLQTYAAVDRRGRTVAVVPAPPPPAQSERGLHRHRQGERLDHYAAMYLADPTAFWRICELNDVMLPEALSEAIDIAIPTKSR
jgi:hypothetical protein